MYYYNIIKGICSTLRIVLIHRFYNCLKISDFEHRHRVTNFILFYNTYLSGENQIITNFFQVDGKAVVGMYPILYPDCPKFSYASKVPLSNKGYVEGYFDFVNNIHYNEGDEQAPYSEPNIGPS